jgi:hypothetical protein
MNFLERMPRYLFMTAAAGAWLLTATPAAAQLPPTDVITVGTGSGAPGSVVDVPVYIRDTSGTPLGVDQPSGSRIQSYSLKVTYSPTSPVQSITFSRAGITAPLTPAFESSPSSSGAISLLDTFNETTNPIPFTSNAALPGNEVAHLLVTLGPAVTPGTTIALTLDPTLTELTDQGGTSATAETASNLRLTLVNGLVTVTPPPAETPTLSAWAAIALAAALCAIAALRLRV